MAERAIHTGGLNFYDRFGKQIWAEPRGLAAGYKWPQLSIHRGELFGIMARAAQQRIGTERFHTGVRINEPGELAADFDVVVACDGIHSAMRSWMVPGEGPPLLNGVTMWRGVSEMPPILDGRTMVMAGRIWRRVVVYPIRDLPDGRQPINWVAEVHNGEASRCRSRTGTPRWMSANHSSTSTASASTGSMYLRAADEVLAYPMADRDPLPVWRSGRVTLLGDAAHPMYPVGSNGASQAIIDARILARELATHPAVDAALDSYESIRRPATAAIVLANRQAGPEQSMEIVAERAPNGFDNLDDVISQEELQAISSRYKALAGSSL